MWLGSGRTLFPSSHLGSSLKNLWSWIEGTVGVASGQASPVQTVEERHPSPLPRPLCFGCTCGGIKSKGSLAVAGKLSSWLLPEQGPRRALTPCPALLLVILDALVVSSKARGAGGSSRQPTPSSLLVGEEGGGVDRLPCFPLTKRGCSLSIHPQSLSSLEPNHYCSWTPGGRKFSRGAPGTTCLGHIWLVAWGHHGATPKVGKSLAKRHPYGAGLSPVSGPILLLQTLGQLKQAEWKWFPWRSSHPSQDGYFQVRYASVFRMPPSTPSSSAFSLAAEGALLW